MELIVMHGPSELIPDPYLTQTKGSQIGNPRLSTSCGVVEWPDHHCGDDLVLLVIVSTKIILSFKNRSNHLILKGRADANV